MYAVGGFCRSARRPPLATCSSSSAILSANVLGSDALIHEAAMQQPGSVLEIGRHFTLLKLFDHAFAGEADVGRALDDDHIVAAQAVTDRRSAPAWGRR